MRGFVNAFRRIIDLHLFQGRDGACPRLIITHVRMMQLQRLNELSADGKDRIE